MHDLLTKGADPHSINNKGERLLALCKPLSAVALYQFVLSASDKSTDHTLMQLFPEFEARQAEDLIPQLVPFLNLLNEGLQFYPDHQKALEELRNLVVDCISKKKQRNRIPREVLMNSKQLSFSSLSQEELADLQKRQNTRDVGNKEETPKSDTKAASEGEEEEEIIEEPVIGMARSPAQTMIAASHSCAQR